MAEPNSITEALRDSESRFHDLVQNLRVGIVLAGPDGAVRLSNPAAAEILGVQPNDLYGTHSYDPKWKAFYPDGSPCPPAEHPIVKALSNRRPIRNSLLGVVRPVRRDLVWLLVDVEPRMASDGSLTELICSFSDITDLKRAEDAQRESDARLRLLANRVPALLWTVDADLRITSSAGAGLKTTVGNEGSEIHLHDYLGTADPNDPIIAAHRSALGGRTVTLDYNWHGRTCQVHLEPLPDAGLIGVAVDVTGRKEAEQRAIEWKERYDAAIRATGQILYDWDAATGNVTYSGNLESILGYSADEMAGGLDRWVALVHPEDHELFHKEFNRSHSTRTPRHVRYRVRTKEGRYLEVQDDCSFVLDKAGEIVRAVGFVVDLSERKHLEDQLRQAQKMEAVGRLAGGVAHDFNNLLTVILGYSDALRHEHSEKESSSDIDEIENAALRAELLTRQLLAFSRRQMLQMRVLDLNEIVTDTERMLRRLIGEDIELRTVLGVPLGSVKADAGQLQQILVNLAVNSRDAMPAGGVIVIETANVDLDQTFVRDHPGSSSGAYVMLAVTDNGTGMDRETQARIFEPFFTTKAPGEGTGLGLSMVYGSVKQSGGYISVFSEPGSGTTFRIYLPQVDAPAEARLRDFGVPELARGTETVLLVEDEESVRKLIENILRGAGYSVLSATNAIEALTLCRAHEGLIPLMITDVVMPGMSGSELAKKALKGSPNMKVLYMSGYTDDAIVQYGVLKPGVAFLAKPFTAAALTAKLRELLDSPSLDA